MTFDEALELAQAMREEGNEIELVLARLRASGTTIVDSVKIVRQIEHVDLGKAKEIVDSSDTWANVRSTNEQIRRSALRAALEESAEPESP